MLREEVTPGSIADPCGGRRGVHDVGEQDGREDALAAAGHGSGEGAHARPVEGDPGIVADDPGIVAWWDLVGLVGTDVEARTIFELDVGMALERVALVVVLTQPRSGDQADALRPSPARLEDLPADHGIADLVDLDAAERKLADLGRRFEAAMLGTHHELHHRITRRRTRASVPRS